MRGRSSGKTAPPRYPCFTRESGGAINVYMRAVPREARCWAPHTQTRMCAVYCSIAMLIRRQ